MAVVQVLRYNFIQLSFSRKKPVIDGLFEFFRCFVFGFIQDTADLNSSIKCSVINRIGTFGLVFPLYCLGRGVDLDF